MKVDFYQHHLGAAESAAMQDAMKSPFLTAGPKTLAFEEKFSDFLGVKHTLGLTSCTAGLFLALKGLGVGEGDEVVVPAMTFIASVNVILHCGAKPVMCDVEPDTALIDVRAVERAVTEKTKAIIPVHLYGQLCDMKALRTVANRNGVALVEDAAHALEATRDGYRPGTIGDAAAFSFYATKNITCGEGGALSTNNRALNGKARLLRQHGMSRSAAERYDRSYQHWDMVELGYKYNMFDLQAAMLLPQLATIEDHLLRREKICRYYENEFTNAGIEFPTIRAGSRSARHLFTLWAAAGKRDQMLQALQDREIGVAVNYRAVHLLTYYRERFGFTPGVFPNAERIGDRTISIPLYPRLTDGEVEYVAKAVVDVFRQLS